MKRFADPLCAFLLYRAENAGALPEPLVWRPGAAAPMTAGGVGHRASASYSGPSFEHPHELVYPISSELMEDPVLTADNFTYERKNIERW